MSRTATWFAAGRLAEQGGHPVRQRHGCGRRAPSRPHGRDGRAGAPRRAARRHRRMHGPNRGRVVLGRRHLRPGSCRHRPIRCGQVGMEVAEHQVQTWHDLATIWPTAMIFTPWKQEIADNNAEDPARGPQRRPERPAARRGKPCRPLTCAAAPSPMSRRARSASSASPQTGPPSRRALARDGSAHKGKAPPARSG